MFSHQPTRGGGGGGEMSYPSTPMGSSGLPNLHLSSSGSHHAGGDFLRLIISDFVSGCAPVLQRMPPIQRTAELIRSRENPGKGARHKRGITELPNLPNCKSYFFQAGAGLEGDPHGLPSAQVCQQPGQHPFHQGRINQWDWRRSGRRRRERRKHGQTKFGGKREVVQVGEEIE